MKRMIVIRFNSPEGVKTFANENNLKLALGAIYDWDNTLVGSYEREAPNVWLVKIG